MKRLVHELPSLGLLAVAAGLSTWAWTRVPNRMPVHWDLAGEVDRYGSRIEGLLVVPLLAASMYALLLALPYLGLDHEPFKRAYDVLRTTILAYLVAVHVLIVAVGLGHHVDLIAAVGGLSGLLFLIIGNTMGKLRQNAYAGVRTPWTLTSRLSWTKTHRLTGLLFVGTGLVVMPLALVSGPHAMVALLAGTLGTCLIAVPYSWLVWRNDPDRAITGR